MSNENSFKETTVFNRRAFIAALRSVLQAFNTDVPIVVEGQDLGIFDGTDAYGVLAITSDSRGAKNVFEVDGDYNENYVNHTTTATLRLLSPSQDGIDDVIDQLSAFLDTTEVRYRLNRYNVNIIDDYTIKTYKDVSPHDGAKHAHIALFTMTVTYVSRASDYVGVIRDAEIGYGLDDGGVYIHDVVNIHQP